MSRESSSGGSVEFTVSGLTFLGEQDGESERILKGRLAHLFETDNSVATAYLARAVLGNGQASVVLALRAAPQQVDLLLKEIHEQFALVFARSEHLDILFLSELQETKLARVCEPFFRGNK